MHHSRWIANSSQYKLATMKALLSVVSIALIIFIHTVAAQVPPICGEIPATNDRVCSGRGVCQVSEYITDNGTQ